MSRTVPRLAGAAAAAVFTLACLLPVLAAPIKAPTAQQDSVEGRQRPEYDAVGVSLADLLNPSTDRIDPATGLRVANTPLASFDLFPRVGTELSYNTNLLRSDTNAVADWKYAVNPSLVLRSDWQNHELEISGNIDAGRHFSQSSENYTDGEVAIRGRLDLTEFETVSLSLLHGWRHEERGTFNNNFGSRPTLFRALDTTFNWNYQRDALLNQFTARALHLDFDDTDAAFFGDRNQDDRDRWEYTGTYRLGYEFFEDTVFFVEPQVSARRYESAQDDLGFRRDSDGYQVLFGVTYDASAVTFLEAGIGYMWRGYDDAALPGIRGLAWRARMLWNPTDLLTVALDTRRYIFEQILANVGGEVRDEFGLKLDYELLYNTVLSGGLRYTRYWSEAVGAFPERTGNEWSFQLDARRLLNEYSSVRAGWRHTSRNGNQPSEDYRQDLWLIRLELFI